MLDKDTVQGRKYINRKNDPSASGIFKRAKPKIIIRPSNVTFTSAVSKKQQTWKKMEDCSEVVVRNSLKRQGMIPKVMAKVMII